MTTTKSFKQNARVSFFNKKGEKMTGRFSQRVSRANGVWAEVNVAEPRKPAELRYVRESQLTAA